MTFGSNPTTFLSGVALDIPEARLAQAVSRQRLASRLTESPVASLSDCIQLGLAVGLTMSEMQRTTGMSRQTLYRHAPDPASDAPARHPTRPQAAVEILVVAAAEGSSISLSALTRRINLDATLAKSTALELSEQGLLSLERDPFLEDIVISPTPTTFTALRQQFDEMFLRRPDAFCVYVRIPEQTAAEVEAVAGSMIANEGHALISPAVAPSLMHGPELALHVHAPTSRRSIEITREFWRELKAKLADLPEEPFIMAVIPPGASGLVPSSVLDAFLEAVIDSGAPDGDRVREMRERFAGGVAESALAGRCVTAAAHALRRAVGNEHAPRPIVDGESAFQELQPAEGVPVDPPASEVQKWTVAALALATDVLGPIAGGGIASIRGPGEQPSVVRSVTASAADLAEMARRAGRAVGLAAQLGLLDSVQVMAQVITPGH